MNFAIFVYFISLNTQPSITPMYFVFVPEGQLGVSLKNTGVTRSTNVGQTQCERVDLGWNPSGIQGHSPRFGGREAKRPWLQWPRLHGEREAPGVGEQQTKKLTKLY